MSSEPASIDGWPAYWSTAGQRIDRQSIISINRHLTVLIDTDINDRYTRETLLNIVLMIYFSTDLRLNNTGESVV